MHLEIDARSWAVSCYDKEGIHYNVFAGTIKFLGHMELIVTQGSCYRGVLREAAWYSHFIR